MDSHRGKKRRKKKKPTLEGVADQDERIAHLKRIAFFDILALMQTSFLPSKLGTVALELMLAMREQSDALFEAFCALELLT